MDVKEGFCWRCNLKLRQGMVICDSCKIAQYCSQKCKEADQLRHKSVECPTWSTKTCGNCRKIGAKYQCAGCLTTNYCNGDCQKRHWKRHKPVCQIWKKRVKQTALQPPKYFEDFPYYFSNSFANDLLNLESNKGKGSSSAADLNKSEKFASDFSILLPACGDLRQMIKTAYSLPVNFTGSLKFVLNDIDPFAMARNVLLLYMFSSSLDYTAPIISSIWLSLLLSEEEYSLLQDSLKSLIEMDSMQLKQRTNGVLEVSERSYNTLRGVWLGWKNLEAGIWTKVGFSIRQQRNLIYYRDPIAFERTDGYIDQVPKRHAPSIRKWIEDGIIASGDKRLGTTLQYCNPTFTGRLPSKTFRPGESIPHDFVFTYCVRVDCFPFQMWDYLDMIQHIDCDSVTEMCHAFTTDCVIKVTKMMNEKRLIIKTFVEDFLNIESLLTDSPKFDRIFTSNLIDYHQVGTVLGTLEPLLNKENPYAVILTETLNWLLEMDGADLPTDVKVQSSLFLRAALDVDPKMKRFFSMENRNCNFYREYYNNMDYFISYLRGRKLSDSGNFRYEGTKPKLPTWSDVKKWGGLHLRDFRAGRHKVVPFSRRVNARAVNMKRGSARTLEWYRKEV
ncbi:uncharacterized protein [Apostichopus japonicus]|uniref:uncharacterized protein n=1 Tax=Stichopus japonicus TaxID=307972 RepID=UPI003AB31070